MEFIEAATSLLLIRTVAIVGLAPFGAIMAASFLAVLAQAVAPNFGEWLNRLWTSGSPIVLVHAAIVIAIFVVSMITVVTYGIVDEVRSDDQSAGVEDHDPDCAHPLIC
jgi:hypothetical protein